MKSRRTWWMIYAACIIAGFAMLIWISSIMLRLENLNRLGEVAQVHQESLRLALWRMDSWLGPRLAREAARPYFEYTSFYPQDGAYMSLLNNVEADEILTPSPLMNFSSDIFTLHFQRTSAGRLSSPQVPQGDMLEAARLLTQLDPDRLKAKRVVLQQIEPLVGGEQFATTYTDAEQKFREELNVSTTVVLSDSPTANQQPVYQDATQQLLNSSLSRSNAERGRRGVTGNQVQQEFSAEQSQYNPRRSLAERDGLDVGVFVPMWMTEPDAQAADVLFFVRRVQREQDDLFQGILVDWPTLEDLLLEEIADLFPEARLVPVPEEAMSEEMSARTLASVPVSLELDVDLSLAAVGMTPVRWSLLLIWLAMGVVVMAIGNTLRASISFGERRSRFAMAVSHELRTPLTTFCMYSEMLAEGMVPGETQRQEYLDTLKNESVRLAALVDNVLAYARLEEGRAVLQPRKFSLRELINLESPPLKRRAEEASLQLHVDLPDEVASLELETDREVLGQILLNLVDNACKYARDGSESRIDLLVNVASGQVSFTVRDYGPGVDPKFARDLFVAFSRNETHADQSIPGIGLGLALSRGLARDLGGDLALDPSGRGKASKVGASFTVTLPLRDDQ